MRGREGDQGVREEEGRGSGSGCSPEREHVPWVLYLSLEGRDLRGGLWGGRQQSSHQFARCAVRVRVPTGWSVPGQEFLCHCLAAFLGLELKYN